MKHIECAGCRCPECRQLHKGPPLKNSYGQRCGNCGHFVTNRGKYKNGRPDGVPTCALDGRRRHPAKTCHREVEGGILSASRWVPRA